MPWTSQIDTLPPWMRRRISSTGAPDARRAEGLTCRQSDCILLAMATRTLTLRDVPEGVVRALRERARRHRRSMQKEVLSVLQGAVLDRASLAEQLAAFRSSGGARLTLDEIHEAMDEGRA